MITLKDRSCPKCGSENITYTAEIPVDFEIGANGWVYIDSPEEEIKLRIQHEWGEGRITCKCNYCGNYFE